MAFKIISYIWVGLYLLQKNVFQLLSSFTCVPKPWVAVEPIVFWIFMSNKKKKKNTFLYKIMNGLAWGQGGTPVQYTN